MFRVHSTIHATLESKYAQQSWERSGITYLSRLARMVGVLGVQVITAQRIHPRTKSAVDFQA